MSFIANQDDAFLKTEKMGWFFYSGEWRDAVYVKKLTKRAPTRRGKREQKNEISGGVAHL